MAPNRERVWVGLFVVIAAAVLSGTAVAVWGGMGRSGVPHHLYFKFSGGVQPGTAPLSKVEFTSKRSVSCIPSSSTKPEP